MAMVEWISEQSSRELYAYQIEVETQELALVYEAKGGPRVEAQALAERLMSDEHTALDAMAREELGIDPEKRGGSPAVAAVASFVPFTVGAAVPVLPFVFFSGRALRSSVSPPAPLGCSCSARPSCSSPTAAAALGDAAAGRRARRRRPHVRDRAAVGVGIV
jgi:hypothetical protein